MKAEETDYFHPLWDEFDGELFQDLVCDLLSAEEYLVEPSGVGPDGGVDAFAQQQISFGYNNPEPFTWAVQCKFSSNPKTTISPSDVGQILNIVSDERFQHRNITGYFLATNVRLSTNMMSELRGIPKKLPGFKTTYWDRSKVQDVLNKHYEVYKKYFAPPKPEEPESIARISKQDLDEFETLVTSPNAREVEIQAFLEAHPAFLITTVGKGTKVLSQVALERPDLPALRPDFMISPSGHEPWTIVELRRPNTKVVVGSRNRLRFASEIYADIAQLREYRDYLESPTLRKELKDKYGADVYRPKLMILVGNDYSGLTRDEIVRLKSDMPDVEIITYGDIIQRLRDMMG